MAIVKLSYTRLTAISKYTSLELHKSHCYRQETHQRVTAIIKRYISRAIGLCYRQDTHQ